MKVIETHSAKRKSVLKEIKSIEIALLSLSMNTNVKILFTTKCLCVNFTSCTWSQLFDHIRWNIPFRFFNFDWRSKKKKWNENLKIRKKMQILSWKISKITNIMKFCGFISYIIIWSRGIEPKEKFDLNKI